MRSVPIDEAVYNLWESSNFGYQRCGNLQTSPVLRELGLIIVVGVLIGLGIGWAAKWTAPAVEATSQPTR
jgi:hypothetical protein